MSSSSSPSHCHNLSIYLRYCSFKPGLVYLFYISFSWSRNESWQAQPGWLVAWLTFKFLFTNIEKRFQLIRNKLTRWPCFGCSAAEKADVPFHSIQFNSMPTRSHDLNCSVASKERALLLILKWANVDRYQSIALECSLIKRRARRLRVESLKEQKPREEIDRPDLDSLACSSVQVKK